MIEKVFTNPEVAKALSRDGFASVLSNQRVDLPQKQTANAFSSKWALYEHGSEDFKRMERHQKRWYLDLYGFNNEGELAQFLSRCSIVLDAGAGTGFKAAWFARLSPETKVIAVDISESLIRAATYYSDIDNLYFVQGDIAQLDFIADCTIDYISCDQVIHHTADPFATMKELHRVAKPSGELGIYVYRKKALPRELLDDYFREYSKSLSHDELMDLSSALTVLGKQLDELNVTLDVPEMPALGIAGGKMPLQRFIYWNFIKCYWNSEQGEKNSTMINYDWYSPSQAARYSEAEFKGWATKLDLEIIHFHEEEACYSARFKK